MPWPMWPNMLRHTHATELIQSGMEMAYVQKRLNHASIQTTMDTYVHLTNEDMKVATHILRIPTTPDYPSLNLSQAMLLCGYELFTASGRYEPREEVSGLAPMTFRERMFEAWEAAMLDVGFCKEDKLDHMMMGLRRILTRGDLTENDVKILMGLARQSSWAGKKARETGK